MTPDLAERESARREQGIGRLSAAAAAVVVAGVFGAVVLSLDGGDLRAALSRLRARTLG